MLEKFICIDNVGVLKKGVPQAVDLTKLSLVYADNARGKSTLSSLLLACANGTAKDVIDRKTVGATMPQKVILRFSPLGVAAFNSEFDGASWKGSKPNLYVFNQAFVERNVFASAGVLPDQREALLTLALGDAAVTERVKYEQLASQQTDCAIKVTAAETALTGLRGNYPINIYMGMQPIADIDQQLEDVDRRISEARTADQIAKRQEFKTVNVPQFAFEDLTEVIASSFESTSAVAAEMAKAHFAKHDGQQTEQWVANGLRHKPEEECPFCGQDTKELPLLKAYMEYFDNAYSHHMQQVSRLRSQVEERLLVGEILRWRTGPEFNKGLLDVWAESLGIKDVPHLDLEKAEAILIVARAKLDSLMVAKVASPLTALDTGLFAEVLAELGAVIAMATDYNTAITGLNEQIYAHKQKHAKPDVDALTRERTRLMLRKTRYDAKTVELVAAVEAARLSFKNAEAAKDKARGTLDQLMTKTLIEFQQAINEWLTKFSAPFQVDQLAPTYRGGGLRSEYVLKVRGATVNIGPGAPGELSFHTALSEGDKRTLAFAFFLAKLFADPNRSSAVVVLDDVFTSLDKHRRAKTIDAVLKMLHECAQVIPLAHDAHFLRHLKRWAVRKQLAVPVELTLLRDAQDYSYLGKFDLDEYCASDYYKHYLIVENFINAVPGANLLEVAKGLRLLVEGHLHRCFPGKFSEGVTLGVMLDSIKSALAPNPLLRLQSLHGELVHFNDYAAVFHHDTSGGFPQVEVTEAELLGYARSALGFIQARDFKAA
ncbi:hypothetical protein ASC78_07915 [Variovorax sp. Root318D1]|uniref:AAA family ATPase n=1 Tax=Variovorax sp. Root318D1 TaxID=1736513 RepID=UPI0006F69DB9|nr:AAA family ATPase [Variovorax sp. Root318D1]KQU85276.1 hypothetical protein ASC78_07915 [Variovorax sp. Root318D1]